MELLKQITANNIELKEYPFIKELAMEAYLIENENILKLDNSNFSDVTILDEEIALKAGRKTSNRDGRIDILAKYGVDYLAIIELKKNEINYETLDQLKDYLSVKDQILSINPDYLSETVNEPKWVGVMVGTSISPELQRDLQNGLKHNDIPIAGMTIRRYRSEENEVFVISDTFFNFDYSKRDYSKFKFNSEILNKSRLVNKVIKKFVELNPNITFAELESNFPKSLQGTSGVFTTKENADDIFLQTGHKRFYIKEDELIKLGDSIIATSNQWGVGNIMNFVKFVNKNYNYLSIESE